MIWSLTRDPGIYLLTLSEAEYKIVTDLVTITGKSELEIMQRLSVCMVDAINTAAPVVRTQAIEQLYRSINAASTAELLEMLEAYPPPTPV
jgi:hypothetical protein